MCKRIRFPGCLILLVLLISLVSVTALAAPVTPVSPSLPAETVPGDAAFTEDSDFITRDLLYDKATNKQFITMQDRDGNVFYIVIDYNAPVNPKEGQYKTYFLNPVDAEDLQALTGRTHEKPAACICEEKCVAGKINMNCPVCSANMTKCTGKEAQPPKEEPVNPSTPKVPAEKSPRSAVPIAAVLIVILGAGAFAVWKFLGKKNSAQNSPDDYDDFEEEYEDCPETDKPEESQEADE